MSFGATYYVDATTGNDNKDGLSTSNAWKTINKVNTSSFAPGDYILFKSGGVWRETLTVPGSGAEDNPITFGAYGTGSKPIINGADIVSGWTVNSGNVWRANVVTEPKMVFFNGNAGAEKTSLAELTQNQTWYWSGSILYIFSTSNPNTAYVNPGVEAGARDYGIRLSSKKHITLEGIDGDYFNKHGVYAVSSGQFTARNLTMSNTGTSAIVLINSDDVLIDSCDVSHTSRDATNVAGSCIASEGNTNLEIKNNVCLYSHGATAQGITLMNWNNENVHVHHNEVGYTLDDGIKTYGGRNILIENNEVHNVGGETGKYGTGINFYNKGDLVNYTARYNIIHDNSGVGFSANGGLSTGGVVEQVEVYGNILYNNVLGTNPPGANGQIIVYKVANVKVYENTVFGGTTNGITVESATNCEIKNNIVFENTGPDLYIRGATTNVTFDNNLYYRSDGGKLIDYYSGTDYTVETFSDYQSDKAQDLQSISVDPQLADPENKDFTPLAGSPVCGAADDGGYIGAIPCN